MNFEQNALKLRITTPDGAVRETTLNGENLILGSGPGAGIQLVDPKVSGMHLMLKVERDGSVKAIDLGSEHGTRIGNQAVLAPVALRGGEVISIGGSRVEVVLHARAVPPGLKPAKNGAHAPLPVAASPAKPAANVAPLFDFEPVLAPPEAPVAMAPASAVNTARNVAPAPAQQRVFPIPLSAAPVANGRHVLQVSLAWGNQVLGVQHYAKGYEVTIGDGRGVEFNVFAPAVGERFTLAKLEKDRVKVHAPIGARIQVVGGASRRLAATAGSGVQALELGPEEAARIDIENVTFLVRQVVAADKVPVKGLHDSDWGFLRVVAMAVLVGAASLAVLKLTPKDGGDPADSISDSRQAQMVRLLVKPAKPVELPKKRAIQPDEKSGAEEGAKAKDEEGKFGKKDAIKEEADPSKAGSPTVDPNKKEKDRRKVQSTGLLAAFGKGSSEASSNVLGPGGVGTGLNEAFGGRKGGAGFGDARGVGGLGTRGTGAGGGGTGLGIGGTGTKGDGRGAGGGGLDLGGKGHSTVKVIPGRTNVVGGLSKEVIERVIRSHQSEIKYCYESELNKAPDLSGKVAVGFTIGPDGSVTAANVSESTLGSSGVEQCMLGKIRRWRFPEVPGGGVVDVTYPWVFKPAGG